MSTLKFVIHSATNGGQEDEEFGCRPKRAKHACQACQSRKVKCSGTQPCSLCEQKHLDCVYKENGKPGSKKRKSSADSTNLPVQPKPSKPAKPPTQDAQKSNKPAIKAQAPRPPPPPRAPPPRPSIPQTVAPPPPPVQNQQRPPPPAPPSTQAVQQHPPQQQEQQQQQQQQQRPPPTQSLPTVNPPESESQQAKRRKVAKTQTKTTRQPFFRWLGPTAIAPPKSGRFRLLSVNLRSNESAAVSEPTDRRAVIIQRPANLQVRDVQLNGSANSKGCSPAADSPLSDHELPLPTLPHRAVYGRFFKSMSNILPYLTQEEFETRINEGVVCECLLYAMAALSEKLSPTNLAAAVSTQDNAEPPTPPSSSLAERYLEAAKRLVLPHLASPSVEIVYTLLLIAYGEFGEDRDSGLWAWSGMAIRMSYDLGLHKASSADDDETRVGRNVFWGVFSLDRIISCGTGRNATIPDCDIEHDPPLGVVVEGRTDPFPYLCRLFKLLGKVSNYLNSASQSNKINVTNQVSPSSLSPESWDMMETFAQFQQEVSEFYTSLPPDLLFDVHNFQEYTKIQRSQVFLLLHVWNQALVLAVHHPTIVYPKCHLDVIGLMTNPHAELTGSGAISIADMIAFADLIEPNSFLTNPFLSQPIHMAASASLTLWHTMPQQSPAQSVYTLQRAYTTCRQILVRCQRIWRGISWHSRYLDSLAASEPDVDLSVNPKGFITTRDSGVVRKAAIDENTRKWLAAEMGSGNSDDIYGLFIAGATDDFSDQQTEHFNFLAALRDTNDMSTSIATTTSTAPAAAAAATPSTPTNMQVESGAAGQAGAGDSEKTAAATTPPQEDTFRNFVMRNIDLDEYFKPTFE